ncbi:MAG: helix-turn-helix domain-containing protein [Candidatus Aenigmatarchaeota archaeon]|nr:MAG: helix-turn-helix domain-containing protein [Candidatus Aenigmarchaeota archaeon]
MEDEKITLGRESFRALASDTRIAILKSLDKRRKMLTELSKQLDMSPSTVKEHMERLTKAGLVVMIDDGHKWKYYELTNKGRNVLHPADVRIWILLSVSIFAVLVAAGDMVRMSLQSNAVALASRLESFDMIRAPAAGDAASEALPALQTTTETAMQVPYFHIAALIIFGALALVSVLYIVRKRSS